MALLSRTPHFLPQLVEFAKMPRVLIVPPMAYVSNPKLVVACASCESCEVAFLAAGYFQTFSEIEREVTALQGEGVSLKPFRWGIGFITWHLDAVGFEVFQQILTLSPPALWFSFGNAAKYIEAAKSQNPAVAVFVQIQDVHEAIVAAREWGADVIVVQGREAGGHGSAESESLMQVLEAVTTKFDQIGLQNVRIAAAGGIVTGRQVLGVLAMGAHFAVMGTRFAASTESSLPEAGKRLLVTATETKRTRVYNELRHQAWPWKYDFRVLSNLATKSEGNADSMVVIHEQYKQAAKNPQKSTSDFQVLAVGAGEGVTNITSLESAKDIMTSITYQIKSAKDRFSQLAKVLG